MRYVSYSMSGSPRAQAFERKVDVLTRGGLRPGLDDGIAADAIEAF